MRKFLHKNLAAGRWFKLSLAVQMANIGSEVGRSCKWQGKNKEFFNGAVDRALELFDLTLEDSRWSGAHLREIARVRELFCNAVLGEKTYQTTLEDLDRYFLPFTFLAQKYGINI